MGWFNKTENNDVKRDGNKNPLPELPKLPELPELPPLKEFGEDEQEPLHKLPSFPTSSLGEKFSQNTIKEAIVSKPKNFNAYPEGKKSEKVFQANDFVLPRRNIQMMQKPQPRKEFIVPKTKEIESQKMEFEGFEPSGFETQVQEVETQPRFKRTTEFEPEISGKAEPVFIRIDKFEESLKIFEKTKKEVAEIEKALKDIADVRADEDKELENWQNDIIKVKDQIEKVDKDIFSKIE